jgi:hypothetical protein
MNSPAATILDTQFDQFVKELAKGEACGACSLR